MSIDTLSISILRDTNSTLRGASVSVLGVNTDSTESLADFVRRVRNEKGYSQPEVEKNSGFTITDGYISQIENGYIKNVSPEKLLALAKGLGVPVNLLLAVVQGKSPTTTHDAGLLQITGYYEDSPFDTQQQMILLCETLWQDAKRKATEATAATKKKRSA